MIKIIVIMYSSVCLVPPFWVHVVRAAVSAGKPRTPLPDYFHQLLRRDTEVFPCPVCSKYAPGSTSR